MPKVPKLPLPLPPELEAAAQAVLEEDAKASSAPVADAVADAAGVEALRVGPLTFREVTFGDVEALRLLGSPFYWRLVNGGDSVGEVEPGALVDVVYLLTNPAPRGLALAQQGAAEFRKVSSASANLVDAPMTVRAALSSAVEECVRRALNG